MSHATRGTIKPVMRAAAPIAILLFTCVTLFCFPPEQFPIYPRCPILALLHIQCPGCGATRALAALLHLHLAEALRLNALVTIALPFVLNWALRSYLHYLKRTPLRWPQPRPSTLSGALAVTILFTIARNL